MNQSVANHFLRDQLKEFGNFVSNPIKIKLIYTNRYGKQIGKKIDFITIDSNVVKNKYEIENKLDFINIVNYDSVPDSIK